MTTEKERQEASEHYKRGHITAYHECIRLITKFAKEHPEGVNFGELIDFIIESHNQYPLIEQIKRKVCN
jgi:hypothetical protein